MSVSAGAARTHAAVVEMSAAWLRASHTKRGIRQLPERKHAINDQQKMQGGGGSGSPQIAYGRVRAAEAIAGG